jgi:carboxypeptidase C (cathepsin A)
MDCMRAGFAGRRESFLMRFDLRSALVLTLAMGVSGVTVLAQQAPGGARRGAAAAGEPAAGDDSIPIPPETSAVTKHDWVANGKTIHYTATAGNLLIRDEAGKANGSIFYAAYTEDGADPKTRPVTFFYNGGPGSATIWLHMGSLGPIRVVTDSPKATGPAPFQWVTNEYSLIDKSDLVFIDAPRTGFSRVVGKGTPKDFDGVDEDIRAFNKFITRYISVNQRWNSPKFLFGESYGTTRSAGLVASLNNDGIEFNGVTLLSSILNYGERIPGYDTEAIGYFPSFAAIAWQHNKVKHTVSLAEWVQQAREFAAGPYLVALHKGNLLPPAEFDAIAAKIAGFTGLSVTYVKDSALRIDASRFRKELLRDEDQILGRYDARFEALDGDQAGQNPGFDPSDTGINGVYVGAFHTYIEEELKYKTQEPYLLSAPRGNGAGAWNENHVPSGGGGGYGGGGRGQVLPDVAVDLADAMRKNPKLKVFSANGYFDLATPFFNTEYDLHHMLLPPSLASNIEFGYYPSGHMVYLNVEALKMLKADMARFYTEATQK